MLVFAIFMYDLLFKMVDQIFPKTKAYISALKGSYRVFLGSILLDIS